MNEPVRLLLDPETGMRYRVRIVPRELTGGQGISPMLNSLVFETEAGAWIGLFPVSSPVKLADLSERELRKMLGRARRRGL